MGISSLGIGSGLDINGMISQLIAAEGQPKTARLDRKEAELQAQISAMGSVSAVLSDLQSTVTALTDSSEFFSLKAKSSNTDLFTATAGSEAVEGIYSIEVQQLAEAQSLATTASVTDLSQIIGTGTLSFSFASDGYTATETVDITDGTLTGIRDAINSADIGVDANIVFDGTNYRLVLNAQTGTDNAMRITVSDNADSSNTDNAGLSMLYFNGTSGTNMEETNTAQDAQISIDGIQVTSASNTITTAISGVTIELEKAELNTISTLTVSQDTSSLVSKVSDFIDSFNMVAQTIKDLTYYNPDTEESGLMIGDATLRGIDTSLRRVLGRMVGSVTDTYNSLANLGITTERDGSLSFDSSKLEAALADNPEQVAAIFAGGTVSDAANSSINYKYRFSNIPAGAPEQNPSLINLSISQEPTHGTFSGAEMTPSFPFTIVGTGYSFDISVDGGAAVSVSLVDGTSFGSKDILATYMQNQINGALSTAGQAATVTVSYNSETNGLDIASDSWGSASSIQLTNVSSLMISQLGFAEMTTAETGLDIAGSVDGESATGSGATLTVDAGGNYAGMIVEYIGGEAGGNTAEDSLSGIMSQMAELLDGYLSSSGIIQSKTDSYNSQIEDIGEQRETLARRLDALEQRYISQFTAMDIFVAQMNSTGSYLSQQLQALANLNKKR